MYSYFQQEQLVTKIITRNPLIFYKSVNININIFKLKSITHSIIIKSLYILEFCSGSKSFINYFKKNYKEMNIQLMIDLNIKNSKYFFDILKIFYLPILYRRNLLINKERIFLSNFNYTISNLNILTFLPDVYFRWDKSINCFFNFRKKNSKQILLYLYYFGFNFAKFLIKK